MSDNGPWCEWNLAEQRAAYSDENHALATWRVGAKGQYFLCDECANLQRFKRFRSRERIKGYEGEKWLIVACGWILGKLDESKKES